MDNETHKPTHLARSGNPRAETAALSHGARTAAARRGELPAGSEHLLPLLDSFHDAWVSDLGGDDEITGQRRALLHSARVAMAVILLAADYMAREGFTNSKGRPQPVLALLATYLNSLRLALVAVGLERVARDITPDTLQGYIQRKAAEAGDPA